MTDSIGSKSSPSRKDEAFKKRMRIWYHNSLCGAAAMAESNARKTAACESVSPKARSIAYEIERLAVELRKELKTRIDP